MCNLKANKSLAEIIRFKKELENLNLKNKELIIFPSSIYLSFFYDIPYKLGSQNISQYTSTNHTGEILASQLASLNVSYTIINHCETDETSSSSLAKIRNAVRKNIKVVYCIGKQMKENNLEILKNQIEEVYNYLTRKEMENIIIAYEPCWAINQRDIISSAIIQKIVKELKLYLIIKYNIQSKIVYGGSINIDNFHKLLDIDNLDGYLLGNCANDPQNIVKLAEMF